MTIPGSANPLLLVSAPVVDAGARSLRFNSADSAYLSRTPASAGNRGTWTWAGWVKRSKLGVQFLFIAGEAYVGGSGDTYATGVGFGSDNKLNTYWRSSNAAVSTTAAVFRDVAAWYHIVLQANATTLKLFVNSAELLSGSISGNGAINSTQEHLVGAAGYNTYFGYADFLLADVHFIDGQALTPSSFTETDATTGQLIPKAYTGSYGTNGFHLDFADNASTTTIGYDAAGSNDWTANNLSVTAGAGNDSLVDVPTNGAQTDTGVGGQVRGNYATLNPLSKASSATLANGNLDWSTTSSYALAAGTIAMPASGKWYWEVTPTSAPISSSIFQYTGVIENGTKSTDYIEQFGVSNAYAPDGEIYYSGGSAVYGNTWTTNDVIGVAVDLDNGAIYYSKNGTWQNSGVPTSGASKTGAARTNLSGKVLFPAIATNTGITTSAVFNFGQRPFAYTAPSGFKALNTANLPAPVVTKPSTVMDVKLYTGNGSTQSITGLGFSPDLVWVKGRSQAYGHRLLDTVRGATNGLASSSTAAEFVESGGLTAFNSAGFSLGSNASYNENTTTYVAWAWDAGSSTVTNTQGSITSQVRANASAGFSIVTYTGTGANATVGHGLGVAPTMIIVKNRDAAVNWFVYHRGIASDAETDFIKLNTTDAAADLNTAWNDTAPTSTVFSVGTDGSVNQSSADHVAYCFAPVDGYSSFGSYVGNSSSDGVFVFTGFRPRWILLKSTGANGASWTLFDTARNTYNESNSYLFANSSGAEGAAFPIDILSNGFKLRTSDSLLNSSSYTYVYAAFAEAPLNYSRAR